MQALQKNRIDRSRSRVSLPSGLLPALGGVVSLGLALFAIFTLSSWAELSAAHHAVQHVVLFLGGVGVGSSLLGLIRRGDNR